MTTRLLVVLGLFSCLSLGSQSLAAAEFKSWETTLSSALTLMEGNVDAIQISNDLTVTHRDSLLELSYSGGLDYAEQEDIKVQQYLSSRINADVWYDATWSPFVFASIEQNYQKAIDMRWQLGAGGKYTFWRDDDNTLSISAAIVRDQTNYIEGAGLDDIEGAARASIRLKGKHRLTEAGLTFQHVTYYLPSLDLIKNNESDIRWNTDLKLLVPLASVLSLTVSYSYDFENISGDRAPADSELEVGLQLRL